MNNPDSEIYFDFWDLIDKSIFNNVDKIDKLKYKEKTRLSINNRRKKILSMIKEGKC